MGIQALLQTLQILPPVRHMMKCDGMSISAISHSYSTPHTGLYSTCEHRSHRSSDYCILSHHAISPPFPHPIARFNVSTPFFIWSFLPPPSPPPISVGDSRVVGELKAEQPGRVDQHLTFPHTHPPTRWQPAVRLQGRSPRLSPPPWPSLLGSYGSYNIVNFRTDSWDVEKN